MMWGLMTQSPAIDILKFCEAIGAPVVAAAVTREDGAEKTAQAAASLLERVATCGIDIARLLGPGAEEGAGRLATAAIAAPMVAALYAKAGEMPKGDAMAAVAQGMQAAVTAAQGYKPPEEGAKPPALAPQLAALAPAVGAVAAAPMKEEPRDAVLALAPKLVSQARALHEALTDAPAPDKTADPALLKSVAEIYAACRTAPGAKDPDGVWAAFEERAAMLLALARGISGQTAPPPAEKAPEAPAVTEKEEAPPAEPQKKAPMPIRRSPAARGGPQATEPSEPPAPPEADSAGVESSETNDAPPKKPPGEGGNPMSFFKKKKSDGE